jgi:hypothetical protein
MLFSLFLFAAFCSSVFANSDNYERELIFKIGFQPQGIVNSSENTKVGYSGAIEFFKYFKNVAAVGFGAMYDFPRKFENSSIKQSLAFLPLYVALKLRTPLQGLDDSFMFITGKAGYSSVMIEHSENNSSNGGAYYALGMGVSVDVFLIEAIYAISNYTFSNESKDYKTITVFAGIKLG